MVPVYGKIDVLAYGFGGMVIHLAESLAITVFSSVSMITGIFSLPYDVLYSLYFTPDPARILSQRGGAVRTSEICIKCV